MASSAIRVIIGSNKFQDNLKVFFDSNAIPYRETDLTDLNEIILKTCNHFAKLGYICKFIILPNTQTNRAMTFMFEDDQTVKHFAYYEVECDVIFIRNCSHSVTVIDNKNNKVWLNYDIRSHV